MKIVKLATTATMAALLCFAASCRSIQFSGSNVPTDNRYELTQEDYFIASDTDCLETVPLTGNPGVDVAAHEEELKTKHRVKIKEGNPFTGLTTALQGVLWVRKGYSKESDTQKAVLLAHELVHYCQRKRDGNQAFEIALATSAGRYRAEVPAYRMTVRAMRKYGWTKASIDGYIERRIPSFKNTYWMHDLAEGAFTEAIRIMRQG